VVRLGRVLVETLAPLLPTGEPYALLDYPSYANVGDSAIWLGALALLDAVGAGPPAYVCDADTYDADALRRRVGAGPILLLGGGNFGDLYPRHQALRERVARDFPANRMVQLPQSLHFGSEAAASRARAAFTSHEDYTLAVRDRASLETAQRSLGVRAVLCPDLAFALGSLPRPREAVDDVVWILRGDAESGGASADLPREPSAWTEDPRGGLARVQRRLTRRVARAPGRRRLLAGLLRRTYTPMARRRLARGLDLLAGGRVVVTDRLHGHVLCLLLGIPHVVRDSLTGKVAGLRDAFTADDPLARFSDGGAEEVRALVASLLGRGAGPEPGAP